MLNGVTRYLPVVPHALLDIRRLFVDARMAWDGAGLQLSTHSAGSGTVKLTVQAPLLLLPLQEPLRLSVRQLQHLSLILLQPSDTL